MRHRVGGMVAALVLLAGLALLLVWRESGERAVLRRNDSRGDKEARTKATSAGSRPALDAGAADEIVSPPARVIPGGVFARSGGVWGVEVVAYVPGTEERIGEAWTHADGSFALEFTGHERVDLVVQPKPGTDLAPIRRAGCPPARYQRFDLVESSSSPVCRLAARSGGLRGQIRVLFVPQHEFDAIRAGTGEPDLLHPRVYGAVAAGNAITDRAHRFRIRGLDPGQYALVIASEAWMLEEPLLFTPDREFVATVVPALGLHATVRDIETGEPIPAFRAIVENVERLARTEFDGEAGRFSVRVPLASARAGVFFSDGTSLSRGIDNRAVRFEAPGFVTRSVTLYRLQASFRPDPVVWLWPVSSPEIEVAVVYDDGVPYQGVLWGTARAEWTREVVRFVMVQAGRYRARIPRGEWDLSLRTAPSHFRDPWQVTVKVMPGESWKRTFVRPRGGTLILQSGPEARTGQALATVSFRAEPGDRIQRLDVALHAPETVLEDLPPGEYWVRSRTATPVDPRKDRPIRLAPGGRQAVRIR